MTKKNRVQRARDLLAAALRWSRRHNRDHRAGRIKKAIDALPHKKKAAAAVVLPRTPAKVIAAIKPEVGYHEGRSGGHWNNIEKYAAQVPGLEWANGQAWCAVFASWGFLNGGLRPNQDFPVTASCDAAGAWYKTHKRWSEYPAVGAQVLYGSPSDLTHTGIVIDYDADTITTIEGNTNDSGSPEGDGVYRKVRRRRDAWVVGYGYPVYRGTFKSADPKWKP